jgi:hypothetical protein
MTSLIWIGAFWLTFGATLQPFYFAYGNYSPNPNNEALGLKQPAFNAAFGMSRLPDQPFLNY